MTDESTHVLGSVVYIDYTVIQYTQQNPPCWIRCLDGPTAIQEFSNFVLRDPTSEVVIQKNVAGIISEIARYRDSSFWRIL